MHLDRPRTEWKRYRWRRRWRWKRNSTTHALTKQETMHRYWLVTKNQNECAERITIVRRLESCIYIRRYFLRFPTIITCRKQNNNFVFIIRALGGWDTQVGSERQWALTHCFSIATLLINFAAKKWVIIMYSSCK